MTLWLLVIGAYGAYHVISTPHVLWALSPASALTFLTANPWVAFKTLGGVVLAVTGAEALYADMGHFGRRPISRAWYWLAYPALVLCYFGQGAVLLRNPDAVGSPFYSMIGSGIPLYLVTALATAATVVASQGLITSVYSLTYQAIQLGLLPRLTIRHTCHEHEGRIYVPLMNWFLAAGCIALVLVFGESTRLAAAFGLAVSGTMLLTSFLLFEALRARGKAFPTAAGIVGFFLAVDVPFFASNLLKLFDGGYVPLAVGAMLFLTMAVWRIGRARLALRFTKGSETLGATLRELSAGRILRLEGTGVFLGTVSGVAPPALTTVLRRFGSLPKTAFLVSVQVLPRAYVRADDRYDVQPIGEGLYRLLVRYGYLQYPDLPAVLSAAVREAGLPGEPERATYYLGAETFVTAPYRGLRRIFAELFAFLARNARNPTDYFALPSERVVLVGRQVALYEDVARVAR